MLRRERFRDLVERQLTLFEEDNAHLIRWCAEAELAYDDAPREEAEDRYGDYQHFLEQACDALEAVRDTYARTLDDPGAYEREFNRAARRRLPKLARGL